LLFNLNFLLLLWFFLRLWVHFFYFRLLMLGKFLILFKTWLLYWLWHLAKQILMRFIKLVLYLSWLLTWFVVLGFLFRVVIIVVSFTCVIHSYRLIFSFSFNFKLGCLVVIWIKKLMTASWWLIILFFLAIISKNIIKIRFVFTFRTFVVSG